MHKTLFGLNALSENLNEKDYSSIFILCDDNSHKMCLPLLPTEILKNSTPINTGTLTEQHKNIATCENLWERLLNLGADRHSLIINLGGGIVTDLGGFVAATFKRGIDFIQVPTTLLGMVDASIGGKTGVNFGSAKNQIGTFSFPNLVVIDTVFLNTLSHREMQSGLGEVIKYGLIQDASILNLLDDVDSDLIRRCVKIKLHIAEIDPFEKNERKLLNFGHTIGHALESVSHTTGAPLKHGEAIAWGMLAEAWLSEEKMDFIKLETVEKIVTSHFQKPDFEAYSLEDLLPFVMADKKNQGGRIYCSLLVNLGQGVPSVAMNLAEIKSAFKWLGCRP